MENENKKVTIKKNIMKIIATLMIVILIAGISISIYMNIDFYNQIEDLEDDLWQAGYDCRKLQEKINIMLGYEPYTAKLRDENDEHSKRVLDWYEENKQRLIDAGVDPMPEGLFVD